MRTLFSLLFLCFTYVTFSQQIDYVDFISAKTNIFEIDIKENLIGGEIIYEFDILKDVDSVFVDAVDFKRCVISLNNSKVKIPEYNGKQIIVREAFKAGKHYRLLINWVVEPKQSLYFVGWENNAPNQIWTQGQGKYTSHWLPSIDDMNDKIEFDLAITFDNDFEVIANGNLIEKEVGEISTKWHYDMEKPMSSYLVALAIGKYDKTVETSNSGVPLEMYYYPEDSLKVEPTYRYTKQMFDFLEEEIGVPYPWQNYKQVPVHDFLYAGMENTSLTIFSDAFVVDYIGFNDRNYVNVNAHELAHQWFGNLVTETSGAHHWLQEGFATYYALLTERQVFDNNYYYWRLFEYAQELFDQDNRGLGTSLLNPKSSSTTFYKRGAWVLHALKELVGEAIFKQAVKNYLNKYQYQNVETSDFFKEVEQLHGESLNGFVAEWLEAETFPYNKAMASLEKSVFIQEYLMADCEAKNSKCDYYLSAPLSAEAKSKIVAQVPERITIDVFNDGIKVRQAIAKSVVNIPGSLKAQYESLLDDASYVTQEAALYNLWLNFPEGRASYLDKMKDVQGFSDKNVRQLWLVLAFVTPDYQNDRKQHFFDELVSYTSSDFGFEVRQNAFSCLQALDIFNDVALENLYEASKHFNWRFKSFSKDLLDALSNDVRYQGKINLIKSKN
ncbi:M1 family metallopeptidase [Hanstruepera ponticola]|uniref:M1 family metallopeptidase n=1 Tax=Hanstruepera ponticola TaxID=2042995 RepID=UPI000CF1740E|nr:M1 family metallopeptidase [Hanstruepera ponticola]